MQHRKPFLIINFISDIKWLSKFIVLQRFLNKTYICYNANMSHNVFVYGTLKRQEPNHHWLTNPKNGQSKFIAIGRTTKKYPLIIATKYNIPFVLYKPGVGNYIQGEVYEVDDLMLSNLDILEDHPKYYIREIDEIDLEERKTNEEEFKKCWIYFLKDFKEELLSKPMLENYSSTGSHGLQYLERSKREPNYDHYTAVKK